MKATNYIAEINESSPPDDTFNGFLKQNQNRIIKVIQICKKLEIDVPKLKCLEQKNLKAFTRNNLKTDLVDDYLEQLCMHALVQFLSQKLQ